MPSCDSRPARTSLVLDREEQKNPMHRLYIQLRPTSHPFRNFLGEIKSICTFDLAHVCNQQPAQRLSVIRFTIHTILVESTNVCKINMREKKTITTAAAAKLKDTKISAFTCKIMAFFIISSSIKEKPQCKDVVNVKFLLIKPINKSIIF